MSNTKEIVQQLKAIEGLLYDWLDSDRNPDVYGHYVEESANKLSDLIEKMEKQ